MFQVATRRVGSPRRRTSSRHAQTIRQRTSPTPSHDAFQQVAALHRRHALRRAGHDEVAGHEPHEVGEVGDHLRHAPDQLGEVGGLPHLAVHLQLDPAARGVHALGRHQLAHGRGEVEALAHVPGAAGLLGLVLQVAPRHVEAGAVAPDVLQRVRHRDVRAGRADGDHQLHLMVQRLRGGRVGHVGVAHHHRVGRLGEVEGRLAGRIAAHLDRVLGVIAADAEDAAHREHLLAAADRQGGRDRRRDDVVGHAWADSFKRRRRRRPRPERSAGLEHLPARVHTRTWPQQRHRRREQKKRPDRGVSGRHYCSFRSERSGEPVGETGTRPPATFRRRRRKDIASQSRTQKAFAQHAYATGPESARSRKRDKAGGLFRCLCRDVAPSGPIASPLDRRPRTGRGSPRPPANRILGATGRQGRSRCASRTRTASIVPSGAQASAIRRGAELRDALVVEGVHAQRLAAGQLGQGGYRAPRRTACALAVRRRASGWSPGVEWSKRSGRSWMRWSRLPPSATFSSWKPRQIASSGTAGGDGGADQRQGGGIPRRILRRALGVGGAAVVVRADVGPAAGEDQPVEPRQDAWHQRLAGRRQQHRYAAHRPEHRAHVACRRPRGSASRRCRKPSRSRRCR